MQSRYSIRLLYEAVVVAALASASLWVLYLLNSFQPLGADFAPVWTAAAHLSSAYDIAAITQAQPDFTNLGQRPFAYPPTALLLFAPLGLLPFWFSYAAFTLVGLCLFVWSALRAGAAWWVVVFPPTAFAGPYRPAEPSGRRSNSQRAGVSGLPRCPVRHCSRPQAAALPVSPTCLPVRA